MATTKKISPRNLPGITKHFKEQKQETEKKLAALNKKRVALEKELAIFQDGLEFCEQIYEAGKAKTPAKLSRQIQANLDQFSRMIGD